MSKPSRRFGRKIGKRRYSQDDDAEMSVMIFPEGKKEIFR